jgi:AraC-like DNA-binding protein
MELLSKNMDFLTKHWAPFARRYPAMFPLVSTDYLAAKDTWVRTSFPTCNFSLILRGRGEFHRRGKIWPVQAPCVITQWPGESLAYGPPVPEETWSELYFTYDRKFFKRFQSVGLLDPMRPVWPIADPATVKIHLAELTALTRHPEPESVVDRVDRVCERILLETWLVPRASSSEHTVIQRIAGHVKNRLAEPVNWEAIAAKHGLSTTTFRRRWAEIMGTTPARYLQELRMREACRLLVEVNAPIYQVASAVGFEDEFYFSRRFHAAVGQSPRDYRQAYRLRQ